MVKRPDNMFPFMQYPGSYSPSPQIIMMPPYPQYPPPYMYGPYGQNGQNGQNGGSAEVKEQIKYLQKMM